MIISNYHSHLRLDDGKGYLREYAEYAVSRGMKILGSSPHAPVYYENDWTMTEEGLSEYLEESKQLKADFTDAIEICCGLEIDYLGENGGPSLSRWHSLGLDYRIGSVHSMLDSITGKELSVDGPVEEFELLINNKFAGDSKACVREYFRLETEMVELGGFDIIGHCDLVKKRNTNNRFFNQDEDWYRKEALALLESIAESGCVVEVNTGGIARGATTEVYPSPWMLKEALKLNIPLTISSDAHSPENLDFYFPEARELLKNVGYREIYFFSGGNWHSQPID